MNIWNWFPDQLVWSPCSPKNSQESSSTLLTLKIMMLLHLTSLKFQSNVLFISFFFFLLISLFIYASMLCVLICSVMFDSLQPHGPSPTRLLCPWWFSRQEYWSGLPCPPLGGIPNAGIKPRSLTLQVDSLVSEPPGNPAPYMLGHFIGAGCLSSVFTAVVSLLCNSLLNY